MAVVPGVQSMLPFNANKTINIERTSVLKKDLRPTRGAALVEAAPVEAVSVEATRVEQRY